MYFQQKEAVLAHSNFSCQELAVHRLCSLAVFLECLKIQWYKIVIIWDLCFYNFKKKKYVSREKIILKTEVVTEAPEGIHVFYHCYV